MNTITSLEPNKIQYSNMKFSQKIDQASQSEIEKVYGKAVPQLNLVDINFKKMFQDCFKNFELSEDLQKDHENYKKAFFSFEDSITLLNDYYKRIQNKEDDETIKSIEHYALYWNSNALIHIPRLQSVVSTALSSDDQELLKRVQYPNLVNDAQSLKEAITAVLMLPTAFLFIKKELQENEHIKNIVFLKERIYTMNIFSLSDSEKKYRDTFEFCRKEFAETKIPQIEFAINQLEFNFIAAIMESKIVSNSNHIDILNNTAELEALEALYDQNQSIAMNLPEDYQAIQAYDTITKNYYLNLLTKMEKTYTTVKSQIEAFQNAEPVAQEPLQSDTDHAAAIINNDNPEIPIPIQPDNGIPRSTFNAKLALSLILFAVTILLVCCAFMSSMPWIFGASAIVSGCGAAFFAKSSKNSDNTSRNSLKM